MKPTDPKPVDNFKNFQGLKDNRLISIGPFDQPVTTKLDQ